MSAATHWNVSSGRMNSRSQSRIPMGGVELNYWAIASVLYSGLVWYAVAAAVL